MYNFKGFYKIIRHNVVYTRNVSWHCKLLYCYLHYGRNVLQGDFFPRIMKTIKITSEFVVLESDDDNSRIAKFDWIFTNVQKGERHELCRNRLRLTGKFPTLFKWRFRNDWIIYFSEKLNSSLHGCRLRFTEII